MDEKHEDYLLRSLEGIVLTDWRFLESDCGAYYYSYRHIEGNQIELHIYDEVPIGYFIYLFDKDGLSTFNSQCLEEVIVKVNEHFP